ncbi:MAG: beta-N-acetylhexosaminidase [Oscillospiraceae bacterium]|jgi:hypothetical protein|nr:beta-N-acetylhexosaminidase [Oscillospiraceae bacterium]
MACIPLPNRITQTGESTRFGAFRPEAAPELREALASGLAGFTLDERAGAALSLKLQKGGDSAEASTLRIERDRVTVESASTRGLYYGLATLRQLLASGGGVLRHGVIYDAPSFAHRGVMLDVSRGKMASLDYLKHLAGFLSDLKYNILQLYCEDKLALKKHPAVGSATGAYTKEQIRELDSHCRARFIELQPCIQTYSHMHGVLRLPGYSSLAENDGLFSLAAGNEDVYAFLEDELSETLPWFSSTTLNINMDEAYDIGTGYTKDAVERHGRGAVFLAHICRVVEIARRHGAQKILLWGDVANKYPELLDGLPDNVTIVDWNYNPQDDYPSLETFEKTGVNFWAAGGTGSWNSVFPRVYNAYKNLTGYSCQAKKRGADGFMATDWGDYGHMQPLGLSLYGYMVGAQQAFYPSPIAPEALEAAAWPLIFGDERVERAFRHLMDSNLAPNLKTGFKTMSIYYFFDDLLDGLALRGNDNYPRLLRESFPPLLEHGSAACELLRGALDERVWEERGFPGEDWRELFGEAFLRELLLSARMTRYIGTKGELCYKILDTLADPAVKPQDILTLTAAIHALYREFLAIRRDFEGVWVLRAYETGIEGCLTMFDKGGVQLAETVKWLADQREALIRGEPADHKLTTYTAGKSCRILWTGDFKNLWDRAYPWQ